MDETVLYSSHTQVSTSMLNCFTESLKVFYRKCEETTLNTTDRRLYWAVSYLESLVVLQYNKLKFYITNLLNISIP